MRPHFVPESDLCGALDFFCRTHGGIPSVSTSWPRRRHARQYTTPPRASTVEAFSKRRRHGLIPPRARGLPSARPTTPCLFAMGTNPYAPLSRPSATPRSAPPTATDVFSPHVWNFEVFPPRISKASRAATKKKNGCGRLVARRQSQRPSTLPWQTGCGLSNALPK